MVPPKPEDAILDAIAATLRKRLGEPPPGEVWLGDDSAIVSPPRPGDLVLTSIDATVAGVHVDLSLASLSDLGWKALTVAVSDLAAMGGRPAYALVGVSGPSGLDFDHLYDGLVEAAATWSCPIVGGDVTSSAQLAVTVAVIGSSPGPPDPGPVRRSGASAGDTLFVTGPCGASSAGLRALLDGADGLAADVAIAAHRRPRARLEEGWTARRNGATAMMDVSDGLSIDLYRMMQASGTGAALDLVPLVPDATQDDALGGGEDYELLVATAHPSALAEAFEAGGLRPPICIGRCTSERGVVTLRGQSLPKVGWQHSF